MWSDFFHLHSSSDKYCGLHTMVLFITTTSSWKTSAGNEAKNGWEEKIVKTLKFTDYLHFCSDFCFSNLHFHMESNLIISMIIKWSLSGWWARKYHTAIIVKLDVQYSFSTFKEINWVMSNFEFWLDNK